MNKIISASIEYDKEFNCFDCVVKKKNSKTNFGCEDNPYDAFLLLFSEIKIINPNLLRLQEKDRKKIKKKFINQLILINNEINQIFSEHYREGDTMLCDFKKYKKRR